MFLVDLFQLPKFVDRTNRNVLFIYFYFFTIILCVEDLFSITNICGKKKKVRKLLKILGHYFFPSPFILQKGLRTFFFPYPLYKHKEIWNIFLSTPLPPHTHILFSCVSLSKKIKNMYFPMRIGILYFFLFLSYCDFLYAKDFRINQI